MKKTKKSLSIFLAVIMVISACTALFTATGSAYNYYDPTKPVPESNRTHYDFTDGTGISEWTKSGNFEAKAGTLLAGLSKDSLSIVNDPADESNKVMYMTSRRYNTSTAEIGGGSGEDGAYLLESNTKYRISFRYKWAKDSGRVAFNNGKFQTYTYLQLYKGSQIAYVEGEGSKQVMTNSPNYYVDSTNGTTVVSKNVVDGVVKGNKNISYDATVTDPSKLAHYETYERYKLNEDSEWMTFSYDFNTAENEQKNKLFIGINAGEQTVTGGDNKGPMTDENQFVGLYVDDIVIEKMSIAGESMQTFVYDFKHADGTAMTMQDYTGSANGNHDWVSNSSDPSYNEKSNGKSSITEKGLVFSSTSAGIVSSRFDWGHKFYLKDSDFELGGRWLTLEADTRYRVDVKYFVNSRIDENNCFIGLAVPQGEGGGMQVMTSIANTWAPMDQHWHTFTAYVNGGDSITRGNVTVPLAGRCLAITTTAVNITVESVTVTVVPNSLVPTEQQQSVCADFDGDELVTDIYLPNTNSMNVGTFSVAKDPLDSGRGNVLNVHITYKGQTTMGFSMPAATGFGMDHGKGFVDMGYKLQAGHTYRVSYDIYIPDNGNNISEVDPKFFFAAKGGIDVAGNKVNEFRPAKIDPVHGDTGTAAQLLDAYKNGKWVTFARTITITEKDGKAYLEGTGKDGEIDIENYPYLLLAMSIPKLTNEQDYYFDNIQITDMKVGHSIRAEKSAEESGTGAYQSAGLRFRGTISDADLVGATEVGFAVMRVSDRDALSDGRNGWWYSRNNLADLTKGAKWAYAYNAEQGIDVVYNDADGYKDFQLILTGLTKDGVTDKNLKDTEFCVYMWIRYDNNALYGANNREYTYRDLGTASYASVLAEYTAAGIDTTGY